MIRRYSELKLLKTFRERYEYLRLKGAVGESTFGFDRYLNQTLYHSDDWLRVRDIVIVRDNGCDLGDQDREIFSRIIVHHMNPLTEQDIIDRNPDIFNPEFLITTTHETHNAIHFGDDSFLKSFSTERLPNDTCPWR